MRVRDIVFYLAGSREAILRIAETRWSLLVGVMLVFAGSLARNYDGAYLAEEWPVMLHGVVVSLVNSFILFAMVYGALKSRKGAVPRFWPGYLSFLGLFWMTSPMALLYAIPYERFLEPAEAIRANLNTLAVVSVWRVALMTRVLSVIFGASVLRVLLLVMLFSCMAAVASVAASPGPLIDIMGGLQHSPEEEMLMDSNFMAILISILTFPIWLIGAIVVWRTMKGGWKVELSKQERAPVAAIVAAGLLLACASALLFFTQGEQRNRYVASEYLTNGDVRAGLEFMSSKRGDEFPPIWDPPPKTGWNTMTLSITLVRNEIMRNPQAMSAWVKTTYASKSRRDMFSRHDGINGWGMLCAAWSASDLQSHECPPRVQILQFHLQCDPTLLEAERALLSETIDKLEARMRADNFVPN